MSFFEKYFSDPITEHSGYNIVNTLVYALIAIVCLLLIIKIFIKSKMKFDMRFYLSLIPYALLGAALRSLVDSGGIDDYWFFITPTIFFIIALIYFVTVSIEYLFKKEDIKFIVSTTVGFILLVPAMILIVINFETYDPLYKTVLLCIPLCAIFTLLFYKLLSKESIIALNSHVFDVVTTYVGVKWFGRFEEHYFGGKAIDLFGPEILFVLKFGIVIPLLLYLDHEKFHPASRAVLVGSMLTLGLATGFRDLFTLMST